MEITLQSGKQIILNDQQIDAIVNIKKWIKDLKDKRSYVLTGYAGTGKSTVVKKIIDDISEIYNKDCINADKVLKEYVKNVEFMERKWSKLDAL
jgi:DNA replication protein DnaC